MGLTEYSRADLPHFESITLRLLEALNNNSGDFTGTFISDYVTLRNAYITSRNNQLGAKGNVAMERSDLATTKPELAKQLTINLLTIALQYVGEESKCGVYFNQGILNAAFDAADRRVISQIMPGETQNVFDNITKGDLLLLAENLGDEVLSVGFTDSPTKPISAMDPNQQLLVGKEAGLQAGDAGWTLENKYLNVTNNSSQVGKYDIRKG